MTTKADMIADLRNELMFLAGGATEEQLEEFKDYKIFEYFDAGDYSTCSMNLEMIGAGFKTAWDDSAWELAEKIEALSN